MVKSLPEVMNKLKVTMIAVSHLRQTLLACGITLYGFQGFFLVLLFGGPNVGIEILARFMEFVGILPQRKIIARAVIKFAQHGIRLPFERELGTERHLLITVKVLLSLDQFAGGGQELNGVLQALPIQLAFMSHFARQLFEEIIEQHRMDFGGIAISHFRIKGFYVLGFSVNIFSGDQQNGESVRKGLYPFPVIPGKYCQLINGESSCHPFAVKLVIQSGMVGYVCQQSFEISRHNYNTLRKVSSYRIWNNFLFGSFQFIPESMNHLRLKPERVRAAIWHCARDARGRFRFPASRAPDRQWQDFQRSCALATRHGALHGYGRKSEWPAKNGRLVQRNRQKCQHALPAGPRRR